MEFNKVVKFTHKRSTADAKTASSVSGLSVEEMGAQEFKGELWLTPFGIIVSTFDGENQLMIICNGDQSGMGEVLTVDGPVDSPLKICHTKVKRAKSSSNITAISSDGLEAEHFESSNHQLDRTNKLNMKIEEFLKSIPPEAAEIIKSEKRWEYMPF